MVAREFSLFMHKVGLHRKCDLALLDFVSFPVLAVLALTGPSRGLTKVSPTFFLPPFSHSPLQSRAKDIK